MRLINARKTKYGITECCCTCIFNKRIQNEERNGLIECRCEKDNKRIGYLQSFEYKCRAYKLDPWQVNGSKKNEE